MMSAAPSDPEKRIEAVLAAVARARHAVNNSLTAMLTQLDLLQMDVPDLAPEQRAYLTTIREMALRIRQAMQELERLKEAS
ncbi:MAG: hypothetical protein HY702_03620 [Gemmatimonadetes bacterium]|nr:hypothetical protein [Gemmatimonadota bacterium]